MALVRSKIQKFFWGSMPPAQPPPDILVTCPIITDILATPLRVNGNKVTNWKKNITSITEQVKNGKEASREQRQGHCL